MSDPSDLRPLNECWVDHQAADDQRRFGGLARLYGAVGAHRIQAAHVVVVGLGGVGSWSAEALSRSGVGRISLIEMDHISESNINRQAQATTQTLGQSKIQAMHTRMMTIHPHGAVDLYDEFVTPQNWPELVLALQASAPISALIDACDQVSAKTTLAAWVLGRAKKSSPIFVTAGAAGGKQKAHCVDIDDMAHTTHDPLLAKVRYNLRRQHGAQRIGSMGITCVYSQETVKQPQTPSDGSQLGHADSTLNCHGYGSSVGVTATFGMCAASYVLEKLAKA